MFRSNFKKICQLLVVFLYKMEHKGNSTICAITCKNPLKLTHKKTCPNLIFSSNTSWIHIVQSVPSKDTKASPKRIKQNNHTIVYFLAILPTTCRYMLIDNNLQTILRHYVARMECSERGHPKRKNQYWN